MLLIRYMPSLCGDVHGNICMRGAHGFLRLVNGILVQTDAAKFLSQLPTNRVENIELITSPSAKYDPDGRGGIFNVTTKKGADDGFALITNIQGEIGRAHV